MWLRIPKTDSNATLLSPIDGIIEAQSPKKDRQMIEVEEIATILDIAKILELCKQQLLDKKKKDYA